VTIDRIGFFHFGSVDTEVFNPVKSLERAMEEAKQKYGCLRGCLVVIPEAFNIPKDYHGKSKVKPDPSVRPALVELSERFDVAFVAGLIEDDDKSGAPGFSSAYLIHGDMCELLSRKTTQDCFNDNVPRYTLSQPCDKAIYYGGICMGVLICRDAGEPSNKGTAKQRFDALKSARDLHRSVLKRISECKTSTATRSLLCIPARMNHTGPAAVAAGLCELDSEIAVVVGNAHASHKSVIRFANREEFTSENTDEVRVEPWR